jgi:hypothetical protein
MSNESVTEPRAAEVAEGRDNKGTGIILETRVVSAPNALVTETIFVLSDGAARGLQGDGRIPPR